MKKGILIYGCTGYTGQLICQLAAAQQLPVIIAGRDKHKVEALAAQLNLPYKVFELANAEQIAEQIADAKVVLHCAGPFKFTAQIMAEACIKAATHYLDITGEIDVFESLFAMDAKAKNAGVTLMPGVGFDVVPTDCLAVYLKTKVPRPHSLDLALVMKGGRFSHGTAITVAENMGEKCVVRREGKIETVPQGELTRQIKLQDKKKRDVVAIPWGDVATAYRSTGIPNITVYNFLPESVVSSMKLSNYFSFILKRRMVKNFVIKKIKQRPAGPSEQERNSSTTYVWGEVKNVFGATFRAMLELPEGYTLTAQTALKIASHILQNELPHGTQTPAGVFGADFILQFDKVKRVDLS